MPFPDFEPTIPELLRRAARAHGERTLVVLGERRLAYATAETRSANLACGILDAGVGKGTHLALLMPNGPDWVVAFLAAARIGAVVVPVNTFFRARELGWVLRHCDARVLLSTRSFRGHDYAARMLEIAPDLARPAGDGSASLRAAALPQLRAVFLDDPEGHGWAGSLEELERRGERLATASGSSLRDAEDDVTPADRAVVIYTSGSTAEPRGAIHTHGTIVRHAFNVNACAGRGLGPEDRVWSPMPFFWVGGLVVSFLGAMHAGACLLCEEAFDAERTLDLLERERATLAAGWPHYGKAMASHPSFPSRDLSSLRAGMVEILPTARRPVDPTQRTNSLGMTETCGPHTFGREDDPPATLRGSFGRAIDGVEHKVSDPETGEALPPGAEGEICVRGYSVMQGFHKVERERTFDRDGFYRTGDGGRIDADGFLWFTGRLGDMIKTAGANVAPSEVEAILASFAEIKEAHVVGVPDPARGQNVAAAVVLAPGRSLDAKTLRERLRGELAAYKVPREVVFLEAGDLPFTDSGKIDKRRLRALLVERLTA
ncbi:MAG: class I adenylate-forming enzyme family protein [Alphaproteobacteria bacterium]